MNTAEKCEKVSSEDDAGDLTPSFVNVRVKFL